MNLYRQRVPYQYHNFNYSDKASMKMIIDHPNYHWTNHLFLTNSEEKKIGGISGF